VQRQDLCGIHLHPLSIQMQHAMLPKHRRCAVEGTKEADAEPALPGDAQLPHPRTPPRMGFLLIIHLFII